MLEYINGVRNNKSTTCTFTCLSWSNSVDCTQIPTHTLNHPLYKSPWCPLLLFVTDRHCPRPPRLHNNYCYTNKQTHLHIPTYTCTNLNTFYTCTKAISHTFELTHTNTHLHKHACMQKCTCTRNAKILGHTHAHMKSIKLHIHNALPP